MLPRPVRANIYLIYKSIPYIFKNIDILDSPQYWLKFGNSWPDMTNMSINSFPHLPHSLIDFAGSHLLERESLAQMSWEGI